MKKLFAIFLSVSVLFASCAKIEDITVRNTKNTEKEIVFTTKASVSTKAIVEGTEMTDHFGVYGYVVPGDYSEGGYLMKNAEYDEQGNAANGKSYYWPVADNTAVDFLFTTYSQYYDAPAYNEENGEITITIPELSQELIESGDFNDVLYAQTLVNNHQSALADHARVELVFKHVLSWLQFKAEVADNASVKWVKVKGVKFDQYTEGQEAIEANPGQEYIAPYNDTTDTWINLKNNGNVIATSTSTKAPGATSYTNAYALPEDLVAEIKSYYSVDGGDAGDYVLKLGKSAWDPINNTTATIKKLRIVKEIPEEYKMIVDMHGEGIPMTFFDAVKYLNDNGYYVQAGSTGGKPQVFSNNYVILDAYVNGTAYTVTALNWGEANSVPQYTIVENPGQEYIAPTEGQPAIPAGYVAEGVYSGGEIVLPTRTLIEESPLATYGEQKDTTLNYCSQEWTINTAEQVVLANALVIPQPVPEYVTVTFDICIANETGDDVVITDRRISRKINTGKDNLNVDYVASWAASNKYIYKFKFDGDVVDFTVSASVWDANNTYEYHVWDYTE